MKIHGFCISDLKPFNSTRYYAHVEGKEVDVMYYNSDGYSLLFSSSWENEVDLGVLKSDIKRHHENRTK